jgi:hypothetical protein
MVVLGAAGTLLLVMLITNLVAVGYLLYTGSKLGGEGEGEEEGEADDKSAASKRRRRKGGRTRRRSFSDDSDDDGLEMVRTTAPDSP